MKVHNLLISGAITVALASPPILYAEDSLPYFNDWPAINSTIPADPQIESFVSSILTQMTLEEKVGQMIQPDLREVTPSEAQQYKLGSLLNGGGGWPNNNKYATAQDWADTADDYWLALKNAYSGRGFDIPFIWATDAVHGHNNVYKATVFPHNIGLGAANNPDLIYQIGQATAKEVVATGLDWTFAPTVAAPRDYRWGRVYEGYSEDPEIIYNYAKRMVEGLQGGTAGLKSDTNVISNVKHWVGDGGTLNGVDRGQNSYTEDYLRNIHATGYFSGLDAGAQVVMSSFNSWWNTNNYDPMTVDGEGDYRSNQKIHGSKYLITDVLKQQMGFDGIVVTDWNGQGEVNGCSASNCPQAVIAGNDMFMVTANGDWKGFYQNVINQVNLGVIPMSRIDDAVTRILRVKARAGLWDKPQPSLRTHAGDETLLGAPAHRALAREAVSQSLVLLKNDNNTLPLSTTQSYLITGSGMDSIEKQTGGWSLTWQGTGNTISQDFPGAQTMLMALKQLLGEAKVTTDVSSATSETTAIVVIGEDPYAEMFGDINSTQTLEYSSLKASYMADLNTIKQLKALGAKVITVFYSGRPLYVNEEINHSDAFVAAWLPGTEAGGITDVLFNVGNKDFTGKLSYSWPKLKCSTTVNRAIPSILGYTTPVDGNTGVLLEQDINGQHKPLFPYGYGLSYTQASSVPASEADLNALPLDQRDYGCGETGPDTGIASSTSYIFHPLATEFVPRIAGDANGWAGLGVSNGLQTSIGSITTYPIDGVLQQSGLNVVFSGGAAQIYMQTVDSQPIDYNRYLNANSTLEFDIRMHSAAPDSMTIATHCVWPCSSDFNLKTIVPEPSQDWTTIKIPLQCFSDNGMLFPQLNTPFLIYSNQAVEFDLDNVRYVPQPNGYPGDTVTCEELNGLPKILQGNTIDVESEWATNVFLEQYQTDTWGGISGHVTVTQQDVNGDTEYHVEYSANNPESHKGLVHLQGTKSYNLTNYQTGILRFELFVESTGQPLHGYENVSDYMSVKFDGGYDYNFSYPPLQSWTSISINISDLANQNVNIQEVTTPFIIFPKWAASQAGISFKFKNVRIEQQ